MQIDVEKLYSVKEVVTKNGGILPIGVSSLYAAIRTGKIQAICIGKRRFISGLVLKRLIHGE